MLILTRRPGESLRISDDVVITILALNSGGNVRLGIAAPKHIPVHRQEVYARIQVEKNSDIAPEGGHVDPK